MRWRRLQRYSNCKRRWCEGTHTSLRPVGCSSTGLINICGNRIGEKDDEISLPQDCQIYSKDPEWLGLVLSPPSHQWERIHSQLTSKMSSCGYAEQSKKPPKEGGSVVMWICGPSTYDCGSRGLFCPLLLFQSKRISVAIFRILFVKILKQFNQTFHEISQPSWTVPLKYEVHIVMKTVSVIWFDGRNERIQVSRKLGLKSLIKVFNDLGFEFVA